MDKVPTDFFAALLAAAFGVCVAMAMFDRSRTQELSGPVMKVEAVFTERDLMEEMGVCFYCGQDWPTRRATND